MSDEKHKGEEPEVEAHRRRLEQDEPKDEAEVEAHVRRAQPRKLQPRKL